MSSLIIIGSQGHAKSCIDVCIQQDKYNIVGIIDPYRKMGEKVFEYPIIGSINTITPTYEGLFFIAIGDNAVREKVNKELHTFFPYAQFATLIHPFSSIASHTQIGHGTVIMAGAVVNCNTKIDDFCIVNTNSSIDHDSYMNKYSSLAPNSSTGGLVNIGAYSAVSIGATVRGHLNIGSNTVIGAASLLLHDAPDNVVMYGVPAKVIRERKFGDKYL